MRLNYKQYKRILRQNGDISLQSMTVGEQCPTVSDLMDIPWYKYITLAANNFGYGGMAEELILNYVHPLFLKAKSAASREENPNWCEATTGVFVENYWKAMKVNIDTFNPWVLVRLLVKTPLTQHGISIFTFIAFQ